MNRNNIKSELLREVEKVMDEFSLNFQEAKSAVKYSYAETWIRELIDEL